MTPRSLLPPVTTDINSPAKNSDSSHWNVTIPRCTEIIKPVAQLLEQLLPVGTKPTSNLPTSSGNTFVDALKNAQNQARTQNNAEAYISTTSATLDAFSSLNENSPSQDFHEKLHKSWKESPELTLRIIWNIRSISEGHNNRLGFYRAFGWLYKHHPRTAIENLRCVIEGLCEHKAQHKPTKIDEDGFALVNPEGESIERTIKASHGDFKDLLNIVILALHDELTNSSIKGFPSLKSGPPIERRPRTAKERRLIEAAKQKQVQQLGEEAAKKRHEARSRKAASAQAQKEKAARREKRESNFVLLKEKLQNDGPFLALYATVAQIFADELAKDITLLKRIENAPGAEACNLELELSGAAKWAPTVGGFHDCATNMATAISLVLHARGCMSDLALVISDEMTQQQANTLRGYYRRWINSPLRRFLDVTEVKMSAGKWNKIDYERIPDRCLERNQLQFKQHDENRFNRFLRDAMAGQCRARHDTMLPHHILMNALGLNQTKHTGEPQKAPFDWVVTGNRVQETALRVAEAQWKSLIERMKSSGTFENSLAIVDVSRSMHMTPLDDPRLTPPIFAAIALGILLATITHPPFNNMIITFSSKPELVTLPPGSLAEQVLSMSRAHWSMNADYEAIFLKLLLPAAVQNKVKPEDMVKRLFVFSDMQFDGSPTKMPSTGWETTHDRVVRAFQRAGYQAPQIVYWSLSSCGTQPVLKDTPGTSLVTGFAANAMKYFMKGKVEDPMSVMETTLSQACYVPLKIFD